LGMLSASSKQAVGGGCMRGENWSGAFWALLPLRYAPGLQAPKKQQSLRKKEN
jgi:hypothetical protein